MRIHFFLLMLGIAATEALAKADRESRISEPVVFRGICGASAAAPVGPDTFIVADDEGNRLRVYRRDQGGLPLQVVDLTSDLELSRHSPETDIEGAARIGDRVYWITSHSRNQKGKENANRHRFFATTLQGTGEHVRIEFVNRPYKRLVADMGSSPLLQPFDLLEASHLPPKARGGLNIEGLCATPDNRLLIAFRNPIPGGSALLVPLQNPDEVIAGKPAQFGTPVLLDLNGLGIRDISLWQGHYLIIAGSDNGSGKSRLFSWTGGAAKPKNLKDIDLKGLNPEALIVYPDTGLPQIQLLSDDSTRECDNAPPDARQFRGVWVTPNLKLAEQRR